MKYFSELNYSMGDEDASLELAVLERGSSHVVSIAGSGSRVIPLLSKGPAQLSCVDVSPEQLALTELRIEAVRSLNHAEYLAFLGYDSGLDRRERRRMFKALRLRPPIHERLERILSSREWRPIVYLGRFELMLRKLSGCFWLMAGDAMTRLLECRTLAEQRKFYFSPEFPAFRWNTALFLMGNATVLNALLYRGEFPVKNVAGSAFQNYSRIFSALFSNVLCRESFFFQMLALGELRYAEGRPLEAHLEIFEAAKRALATTRISYHQDDVIKVLADQRQPVDFVSLSDVPSFFDDKRERSFLSEMLPALAPAARVIFRAHLRVAQPIRDGYQDIAERFSRAIASEATQLWLPTILAKA